MVERSSEVSSTNNNQLDINCKVSKLWEEWLYIYLGVIILASYPLSFILTVEIIDNDGREIPMAAIFFYLQQIIYDNNEIQKILFIESLVKT